MRIRPGAESTFHLCAQDKTTLVRSKPTAYGRATLIGSADPA